MLVKVISAHSSLNDVARIVLVATSYCVRRLSDANWPIVNTHGEQMWMPGPGILSWYWPVDYRKLDMRRFIGQ